MLLAVCAFFAATFGAGWVLGWLQGARWLDDPKIPAARPRSLPPRAPAGRGPRRSRSLRQWDETGSGS